MKLLAVIPCRQGSKRLPGKNLLRINKKTLLEYAIDAAKSVTDDIIVSTDWQQAADIAKTHKVKVKEINCDYLHKDHCKSIDVWKDVWEGQEMSILLEPSSPLRKTQDIIRTIQLAQVFGCAFTANKIEKTFTTNYNGYVSQLFTVYKPNGVCYAMKNTHQGDMFTQAKAYVMENESINIDTQLDFNIAQLMFDFNYFNLN